MTKVCDHTSVGMLVWKDEKLLLIERAKFPFGFAMPAGHVDEDSSYEDAAKRELQEEVGLEAQTIELTLEGRRENPCRREGGTWHYWKIYILEAHGEIERSHDETKQAGWYTRGEIQKLAEKTEKYSAGKISEEDWQASPGLEPIMLDWLRELKVVD